MSQSLNLDALAGTVEVLFKNPSLAIPHFSVRSLAAISPERLYSSGVRAVVVDKDNTITAPYKNEFFAPLVPVINRFREIFGERFMILSNSAGTNDDYAYRDAEVIEHSLSIPVIRHREKKPRGTDRLESWTGVECDRVAVIGDRLLTDVLFGNKAGALTIHTQVLTLEGDNRVAIVARNLETILYRYWIKRGFRAPAHRLNNVQILAEDSE